jgi:hypothetical protein
VHENSIAGHRAVRKNFDFAVVGYFFLAAVIVPWLIWFACFLLNQASDDRIIMFYKIIPRRIFGVGSDNLMILFASLALLAGIIEKLQTGRKWYKTECYVRCLILFSSMLLFLNILQIIF